MPDEEKSRLARNLQIAISIVGVTVTVSSFLINFAARKRELSCVLLGYEKLISLQPTAVAPNIKVELDGLHITSLSKINLVIRNTGSVAIKGEDVKEALRIEFPSEVKLLSAYVERTTPSDFSFTVAPEKQRNSVACTFLLLNSGDEAYISVYVFNSEPAPPRLVGRIVDVNRFLTIAGETRNNRNPFPFVTSIGSRRALYWTLLFLNFGLGLLCLGLIVGGFITFPRYHRWAQRWKAEYERLRSEAFESLKEQFAKIDADDSWTESENRNRKHIYLDSATKEAARRTGVPIQPISLYDTWGELIAGSMFFVSVSAFFTLTFLFIYGSPRPY